MRITLLVYRCVFCSNQDVGLMLVRKRKSTVLWICVLLCVLLSVYCVQKLHAYFLMLQLRAKLRPGEYEVYLGDFQVDEFLQRNMPEVVGVAAQLSDNVAHDGPGRQLPDLRAQECSLMLEHGTWPSTSVILVYHSEHRHTLLRTVYSILQRSPPHLLREIILVDDSSADASTGEYLSRIPKVKIIRNKHQEGPIRSSNIGAGIAVGEVVTFVSARCEVTVGWLEPQVQRLAQLPNAVVVPVLDNIHTGTLHYTASDTRQKGGFDWSMNFQWEPAGAHSDPDSPIVHNTASDTRQKGGFDWSMNFQWESAGAHTVQDSLIVRSPIVPGHVYSIRRDRFLKLGKYDPGLEFSGGENIELSLKNWMCGGVVEILTCSHVGQMDLATELSGIIEGKENIFLKNIKRIAEVWMDDYKRFFYYTKPSARMIGIASVMERKSIRKHLKCETFKWYMTNVYPELKLPVTDEVSYSRIQQDTWCMDIEVGHVPAIAKLSQCDTDKDTQNWSIKKKGEITNGGMCLTADAVETHGYIMIHFCSKDKTQRWHYENGLLWRAGTKLCIDSHKAEVGLVLADCDTLYTSQRWRLAAQTGADNHPNDADL